MAGLVVEFRTVTATAAAQSAILVQEPSRTKIRLRGGFFFDENFIL
jgi:hypothetical protein